MDVIANPIVGFISDSLYSTKLGRRFGRRRFFLLISMPLMILYPAIWISGMNFWYYLVTYMGFELVYDLIMVPYDTLAVEMTSDFKQRTYLTGSKALFGNIASFLTGALPGVFFTILGKQSPYAYLATSLTWGIVMLTTLILVYKNSWERKPEEVADEYVGNFWLGLKKMFIDVLSTFRVRAFRLHLGNYLFGAQGALVIFTTMFTYFVVYALQQSATLVSGMNSLNSIAQIIATFAFIFICAHKGFMGPNQVALTFLILCVFSYASIYWLGISGSIVFILLTGLSVIMGLSMGGTYYIPWTVYVFMADIDELVTNRRREGILAGAMYTCNKFLKATILFIIGALLSAAGFKEGLGTQSSSAIDAIVWLFVGGTTLLTLVAMYSTHRLKIFNQATHQIVLDELARVHAGGKLSEVTDKNRKVVEQLTGFEYEKCFGNNNVGFKESKGD